MTKNALFKLGLALTLLFLSPLSGCRSIAPDGIPPKAIKGVLDLREWDLGEDDPVNLSGEYEFYWNQHIAPKHFAQPIPPEMTGFIEVPGFWNGYQVGDKNLKGYGFATYRLKVLVAPQTEHLALKILDFGTAFTLFVNGTRLSSSGIAGQSVSETHPVYFPHIVDFSSEENEFDLVFHVSNFHHRLGGAWEEIRFGTEKSIRQFRDGRLHFGLFLFGSILMTGLYHLGLFAFRRKDLSPLYFGIFCILVSLRTITVGERYLIHIFPNMDWNLLVRFEYLTYYLAVPFFALFIRSLFPKEFSLKVLRIIVIIGVLFSVTLIISPPRGFTHTLLLYHASTVLSFLYGIFTLILAASRKRRGALIILFGFLLLFLTALNDMLHVSQIINTQHLVPFGLFIFIFSQAFFLSMRFSMTFATVERQRRDLRETNEAYVHEIRERKNAEEALMESHERFLNVLDSIAADVYVADMETYEILFMNKYMQESYGNDLTGKICWEVFRKGEGICGHCTNDYLLDDKGEPSGVHMWEGRNPITRKWYNNYDRAIRWDGDRYVRLQVATDLTPQKEAEEALKRANEQLEERVKERTADISKANEELRNEVIERKRAQVETRRAKEIAKVNG